jgi:hypothetical protein
MNITFIFYLQGSRGSLSLFYPFLTKEGNADREVYKMSLERLQNEGISIIEIKPHKIGKGDADVEHFPRDAGLDKIESSCT